MRAIAKTSNEQGIFSYAEAIFDLGTYVSQDWEIDPDVSGVSSVDRKYWKYDGTSVIKEMSTSEKEAVDANLILLEEQKGEEFGKWFSYADDPGVSTTTSTSFRDKVVLITPYLPEGLYRVAFGYGWSCNSTSRDFESRLLEDGQQLGQLHRQEPKDASGSFGSTGTDQRHVGGLRAFYRELSEGVHSYELQYRTVSNGVISSIWDALIEFWRIR